MSCSGVFEAGQRVVAMNFQSQKPRKIAEFLKSAENGLETALYKVRGLLEGNGSIPVYITLDAYQKLLAEKKKMNNVPVSTVLTSILEKYESIEEIKN